MATLWKCVADPRDNPPGPLHAAHAHYVCRRRLTSPAITSMRLLRAPFHFVHTARGVVTRMQNVGEYMLVLALCLVSCISYVLRLVLCIISIGFIIRAWCNYIVDCVGFVLSVCCCIGISLAHYNKSRAPAFGALTLFVNIKKISDT